MKLQLSTNIMFQILNHKNGTRTPPVTTTIGELRDFLEERERNGFDTTDQEDQEHDYFEDFVLLICDDSEDGRMLVSDFPIFRLKNFLAATEFVVAQSKSADEV